MTFTYATLVATLQSFLVENTTSLSPQDFTANVDTILQLGEAKLVKDLDLELFDAVDTVATANGDATVDKPAGYLGMRTAYYTVAGVNTFLLPRSPDFVLEYAGTGNPLYFAEYNEDELRLAPVPTSILTLNLRYKKRPVSLVTDANGTWLSQNTGDALLYACLIASEEFLKDADQAKAWQQRYESDLLPHAKKEVRKMSRAEY